MINKSLKQLGAMLQGKEISSVEMTQEFLNRIDRLNPEINAFITLDKDKTLAQAKHADSLLAAGKGTALTGLPIGQKDIFVAKGWRTTCGSKMLETFIGPYDADIIERFDCVGAVNLGKTNMDEFAMGSSNETSYYGKVQNPGTEAVCLVAVLAEARQLLPPVYAPLPQARTLAALFANPLHSVDFQV